MAKFNHTAHKELWDWLVRNPDKEKFEWPEWIINGGSYTNPGWGCFACGYCKEIGNTYACCDDCPLIWPNDVLCDDITPYGSSLYQKWDDETDLKKRSELACRIRDLPVREGVECI